MKIVYVVGFSPSKRSNNGVGGFDWFYKRPDAVVRMRQHLSMVEEDAAMKEHLDLTFVELPVPDEVHAGGVESIDKWIDSHLQYVECEQPVEET